MDGGVGLTPADPACLAVLLLMKDETTGAGGDSLPSFYFPPAFHRMVPPTENLCLNHLFHQKLQTGGS